MSVRVGRSCVNIINSAASRDIVCGTGRHLKKKKARIIFERQRNILYICVSYLVCDFNKV